MRTGDEWARVGATIRALRRLSGVSQQELAEQVEISSSHLSNIENGRRACSPTLAQRMAGVFAVDPKAIMTAAASVDDPPKGAFGRRPIISPRRATARPRPPLHRK
ncbi:helix-turn-helix domain-containing protein [Nocardia coubleae]|uniref:Helix-turn-helix transcriptional regulator n=1 Tax=Nocardia coubleae TaxID=356147 RepID=A0A846W616_9NOCA|nr:helix-turn-helix transcriptional regulator [Nocardia coubleae]